MKFAADVTAQKLKAADAEGQILAINKSQAVIHFALDGTVTDANEAFLATMGYPLSEVRGRHHRMFVEEGYAEPGLRRVLGAAEPGRVQSGEFKRVAKDGREIWLQASYNPIFDMAGRPFKIVKYATDVTTA